MHWCCRNDIFIYSAKTIALAHSIGQALAYDGPAYRGLEAKAFSDEDWAFGQNTVRVLSGLYGVLRPADLIQPYRLEMGSR